MPWYEFECSACEKEYTDLVKYDESGLYADVVCPYCDSKEKIKLVSTCGAIIFANPEGTDKMKNQDWAFGYKYEKAQAERRAAEAAQGSSPYSSIDDISSGDNFGEVQ